MCEVFNVCVCVSILCCNQYVHFCAETLLVAKYLKYSQMPEGLIA